MTLTVATGSPVPFKVQPQPMAPPQAHRRFGTIEATDFPYPTIPVPAERQLETSIASDKVNTLYKGYKQFDQLSTMFENTHTIQTPERIALRDKIANDLYGAGAKQKERRIDIVIGNMASGKSYLAKQLVAAKGSLLIDQDVISTHLPEYHTNQQVGMQINAKTKALTMNNLVEESWGIARDILSKAVTHQDNVVIPYGGSNLPEELGMIQYLKQHNYRIYYHFVDAPLRASVERAFNRFHEDGRYTNLGKMVERGDKPWQTYQSLRIYAMEAGLLRGCYFWDNTDPKHQPFRLREAVSRSGLNVDSVAQGLNLVG
jgi:shikimate kinase